MGDRCDRVLQIQGVGGVEHTVEIPQREYGLALFGTGGSEWGGLGGGDRDGTVLDRIVLGDRGSRIGFEQGGGLGDHPL